MIFRSRLRIAPDADLSLPPWQWPWLDMADPANWDPARLAPGVKGRLFEQTLSLRTGKQQQAGQVSPATLNCELDNSDGWLTPGHPLSPWYQAWDLGTPVEWAVYAGSPYMAIDGVSGSLASTPHVSGINILGDWTLVAELWPPYYLPASFAATFDLGGKWGTAGNRSIAWRMLSDGKPFLFWSADGTNILQAVATGLLPRPQRGPLTTAVHIDVDNGAAGRTIRFYAGRVQRDELLADPAAFLLGDPVVQAGTTSVASTPSSPLAAGGMAGSTAPYAGSFRRFRAIAGDPTSSDVRADLDVTTMTPGATSTVDSEGLTWTLAGGAEVTNAQVLLAGRGDSVKPIWPQGKIAGLARVQLTISDSLRRLAKGVRSKAIESPMWRRVMGNQANIDGYWPMTDANGATTFASPIPGVPPMTFAGFQPASDDTLPGSKPLPHVTSGYYEFSGEVPNGSTTDWAVEWMFRIPTRVVAPAKTPLIIIHTTGGPVDGWILDTNTTSFNVVAFVNGVIFDTRSYTGGFLDYDGGFFARFESTQNGGDVDWEWSIVPLDGKNLAFSDGDTYTGTCGRVSQPLLQHSTPPPDGFTIGQVIVSHGLPFGWTAQAELGFPGEAPGRRVKRLAEEDGIPVTIDGDPDIGPALGPQPIAALTAIWQEAATADFGIVTGSRSDPRGIHYRTGATRFNQQPRMVIDAGLKNPFDPTRDDQATLNDVTVTRPRGSSARAVDQPHIDKHDLYAQSVPVNLETDGQLPGHAGWVRHLGTTDQMRYPSIPIRVTRLPPEKIDEWLSLDFGDKLRVENLPPELPATTVEQMFEGATDTVGKAGWDAAAVCEPADPWTISILDDTGIDTARERLTQRVESTLGSGIDDNDLSMSLVTVNAEDLWMTTSTSPDHFPVDFELGGEVVTVSAITGTSSPQTATISARSVNGVVKSHAAGTKVRVANPFRLGL